jgi:hypothetical protein
MTDGDDAGVSVTIRPELPVDRELTLEVERLALQARDGNEG